MPVSGKNSLLDANVWLALAFSDHQHHATARAWFETEPGSNVAFCRVTQLALFRHLTNTTIMGKFVQTQAQAWKTYEQFLADPRVLFLNEPANLESAFRRLSSAAIPAHKRWTDAYLTAFALEHGVKLITFDRGFCQVPDLNLLVLS